MIITPSRTASVPLYPDIQRVETFKHCSLHYLKKSSSSSSPRYATFLHRSNSFGFTIRCSHLAHWSYTADISDQLETVQKRALRIIFGGSSFTHHSYESFCHNFETLPLSARRDQLHGYSFFHKLLHPASCLHHLLPPKRHNPQTAKLRRTLSYDIPI